MMPILTRARSRNRSRSPVRGNTEASRSRSPTTTTTPSRATTVVKSNHPPVTTNVMTTPATTTSRHRRRAYSWRNESPPYEKPDDPFAAKFTDAAATGQPQQFLRVTLQQWLPRIGQEARAVATLVAGAAILQCCIVLLLRLASFAYPLALDGRRIPTTTTTEEATSTIMNLRSSPEGGGGSWKCIFLTIPSIIAGCLIRVLPNQVISNNFPGFIYASAWYVLSKRAFFVVFMI